MEIRNRFHGENIAQNLGNPGVEYTLFNGTYIVANEGNEDLTINRAKNGYSEVYQYN